VSRKEPSDGAPDDQNLPGRKAWADHLTTVGSRRDDVEFNEIDVRVRISYKTLLLIFVLFDVFHKIINATIDVDFLQDLF